MIPTTHRVLFLLAPETVELRQRPVPSPKPGELLLRVDAATTCGTDLKVYRRGGHPRMLETPCPFGHEVAGSVAAVGKGVAQWAEGDRVVIANSASCGRCEPCLAGRENLCQDLRYVNGAYAEYLLVPERFVRRSTYRVPDGLDPAVAALAEPLACVLHGLSTVRDVDADEVLVLGGGPIGLMFVIELACQGRRVILGDLVPARLEIARSLGAAQVVRLSGESDDSQRLVAATRGCRGAGLVVEATGVPGAWINGINAVAMGGTAVLFGGCAPGTHVACDGHRLHYSELTIKGVYHHRPATFMAALERLGSDGDRFAALLSEERPLAEVELALRRMGERKILKAAIRPSL